MNDMVNKTQGLGLALLTKFAGSDVLDKLKIRKFVEKSLFHGSKTGFKTLSSTQKVFKKNPQLEKQRLPSQNKNLFDLSFTDEQKMTVEAMEQFATEVLFPLAAQADQTETFPSELWNHLNDLGINFYALPEALGGVAAEQSILSHVLMAEALAKGDYALTAGLLSTFSAINCLTRWGTKDIQATYLSAFSEDTELKATFAVQEETPAFNPYQLKTQAIEQNGQIQINGEKSLVILGELANLFIVSAEYQGQPNLFIVEANESVQIKKSPAMGLKPIETTKIRFENTPAQKITDQDFNYQQFIDLGDLMWCAIAVGTCEAVKKYCIEYANERTAFGEPISHRQSVAFMIADMAIEIDAMRLLVWNAASLAEAGQDFHREAYLARLLCAEKSMKIGTDGVQILGGHGFTKEHPVERWYRDLRATAIMHSALHA